MKLRFKINILNNKINNFYKMKSIKILIALCLVIYSLSSEVINHGARVLANNKMGKNKDDTTQIVQPPANPIPEPLPPSQTSLLFCDLFTDPDRKINSCECMKENDPNYDPLLNQDVGGTNWNVPRVKRNIYEEKKQGFGPSAYLFDFLDDIFQKEITTEFLRIFNEARSMSISPDYKEPYTLEAILGYTSLDGPKIDEEVLLNKVKSISPSFNSDTWRISITCAQIDKILKQWKWQYDFTKTDPAKILVDTYDYDGDGRLNPREFLIAMIMNNKKVVDTASSQRCLNCFDKIIETLIDPIFSYMDCSMVNVVSADDIWKNFRFLKRSRGDVFNMYSCKLENGSYRTSAVNDFLLKAHRAIDGRLNKEEFRYGVLVGYWDRHTDSMKIYQEDTKNLKNTRWSADGVRDVVCDRIQEAIRKVKN